MKSKHLIAILAIALSFVFVKAHAETKDETIVRINCHYVAASSRLAERAKLKGESFEEFMKETSYALDVAPSLSAHDKDRSLTLSSISGKVVFEADSMDPEIAARGMLELCHIHPDFYTATLP